LCIAALRVHHPIQMSTYRQPILALILRVFAVLAAAIACVALGVIIVGLVSGQGAAGVLVALPVLVSSLVSALILFGVAQVIDYLGRTAHAAEEAATAAKDSADLLRQLLRSYGHEPEV
jgi:flagellar motor component MotA